MNKESTMRVTPGDFSDPRVVAMLETHVRRAVAETARGSAHALDLNGLQTPDINVWTLWSGKDLLGCGALRRLDGGHGEVKSMFTAEAARGRGAGSRILTHIIDEARGSGLTRLSLETGSWDYFIPARAFYRKHGFRDCEPFGDYRPDPNSVFLTLDLTQA